MFQDPLLCVFGELLWLGYIEEYDDQRDRIYSSQNPVMDFIELLDVVKRSINDSALILFGKAAPVKLVCLGAAYELSSIV